MTMTITFKKGHLRSYSATVLRDDGVELKVPGYDRKYLLPHDLAHYIIERELGLQRGFWGCVAVGAILPGMTMISGRQPPRAAARSKSVMKEAGQHGTEAEVLVSVLLDIMHKGLDKNWSAASAILSKAWKPVKPSCGPLTVEEVRTICQMLRDAQEQWQKLPSEEVLRLPGLEAAGEGKGDRAQTEGLLRVKPNTICSFE
ncbi:hypothetical protein HYR99_33750 [Candidatus Poribacteria bacterium]|nr:hypothetical protein [Candidatus Poribacteria bacterium]